MSATTRLRRLDEKAEIVVARKVGMFRSSIVAYPTASAA